MDKLFLFAVFLIPFDNLSFAPSSGWAAVSPYFFFLYALLSLFARRGKVTNKITTPFIFMLVVIMVSCIRFFWYEPEFNLVVRNFVALVLGFSFLLSLSLYLENYSSQKELQYRKNNLLNMVFYGYVFSLVYGVVYIVAFKLNVSPVISLYELIQSRNYGERFQFSFTEPSFSSLHLFGILPFFIMLGVVIGADKFFVNRLSVLMVLYFFILLFFLDSARFMLDFVVFFYLLMVFYFLYNKPFLALSVMLISFFIVNSVAPAILELLVPGRFDTSGSLLAIINSDASSAARFFRSSALYYGVMSDDGVFLWGAGLSNAWHSFHSGFDAAFTNYTNGYLAEILSARDKNESNYFNMHLRLISEFGLFVYLLVLYLLFDKRFWFLYVLILYFYLQFDSFAFYLVWLYLFIKFYSDRFNPYASCDGNEVKLFFLTKFFYSLVSKVRQ
ncbi:hypothetical protein J3998_02040 [Thiomicrorhabdus sp. 6S2-11]|uniref:Uncharacterized protein n=1 Tax=Thiomicrorhabdus marina TaxID=2818442 RepID=A0ABS3Q1Y8_9GAMM|nr:hypothetical protein [Thiomicrorhabdus marina]MBO1926345.1 hypothetical protein [Thiomicrorhabdus marina]